MSVVVSCKKCGTMLGAWGGIAPPRYDLSNKEMGFGRSLCELFIR